MRTRHNIAALGALAVASLALAAAAQAQGAPQTVHSRVDDISADLVQGHADIGVTNREGELVETVHATGRHTVRVYRPAAGRGTSHYSMDLSVR